MKWYKTLKAKVFFLLFLGPVALLGVALLFGGIANNIDRSFESQHLLYNELELVIEMAEARWSASNSITEAVVTQTDTSQAYNKHKQAFNEAREAFIATDSGYDVSGQVQELNPVIFEQIRRERLILSNVREGDYERANELLTPEYLENNKDLVRSFHQIALSHSAESSAITENIQAQIPDVFFLLMIVFAGTFLLASVMILVAFRRFQNRIDNFTKSAKAIAAGDFSQRVDVQKEDELGQFGQSFNRMAQRLQTAQSSLSREVESRTRALEESLRKLSTEEDELEETEAALLNILEDIKQDEQRLKESEQRYRSLLETVPVGIAVYEDYKVKYANQTALEMVGVESMSQVMGRSIFDFVANESKKEIMQQVAHLEETGEDLDLGEQVFQRRDGEKVYVEAKVVGVMFEGEPAGLTAFIDVSQRKEAEGKLRRLNRLKSRFITALSSVTQAPMEAIAWNLDMLLSGDFDHLNPEQKVLVHHALDNKEKIKRLIENMRMVLDIERGTITLNAAPVSLSSVLTSVAGTMTDGFNVRDLELYMEIPEQKLPAISIDAQKMRVVMRILLENAMFYTPEDGRVDIRLRQEGGVLRVEVEDTGIGVPATEQDEIFTRFFRASNAASRYPEGVGIGLYIARSIIQLHGGEINFDSTEGKGSVFWFELPI